MRLRNEVTRGRLRGGSRGGRGFAGGAVAGALEGARGGLLKVLKVGGGGFEAEGE